MASTNPSFGFFDPDILAILKQSFDATWPVLEAHQPLLDSERRTKLQHGLSRMLVALVAEGVIEADQLRKLALERLPLPQRETPKPSEKLRAI